LLILWRYVSSVGKAVVFGAESMEFVNIRGLYNVVSLTENSYEHIHRWKKHWIAGIEYKKKI